MKEALGIGRFPVELTLNYHPLLPVPAVQFEENPEGFGEMGGIQSFSVLPGDPTFNQTENKYDSPSYKRICAEFGIDPNADFRFTHGQNHGLGYCYVPGDPQPYMNWIYPPASLDNPSSQRFSDERGSATETGYRFLGNELDHIINEQGSDRQFDWFAPEKMEGLTQAGLSCINQSIEAFVYCVLWGTGKRSQQFSG